MTDISKHPLLAQAVEVCHAIELCGASPQLTDAVTKASMLVRAIDEYIDEVNANAVPVALDPSASKKISETDFNQAISLSHAIANLSGSMTSESATVRLEVNGLLTRLICKVDELLQNVPKSKAEDGPAKVIFGEPCSLQQYLEKNKVNGIIDFSVRCTHIVEGDAYFYIHPATASGETLQFAVRGNIARNQ